VNVEALLPHSDAINNWFVHRLLHLHVLSFPDLQYSHTLRITTTITIRQQHYLSWH